MFAVRKILPPSGLVKKSLPALLEVLFFLMGSTFLTTLSSTACCSSANPTCLRHSFCTSRTKTISSDYVKALRILLDCCITKGCCKSYYLQKNLTGEIIFLPSVQPYTFPTLASSKSLLLFEYTSLTNLSGEIFPLTLAFLG